MSTTSRLLFGFIITLGAAGGVEQSVTDTEFALASLCALAGMVALFSGVSRLKYDV